jgi:uncharacterized membrane protein YkoI
MNRKLIVTSLVVLGAGAAAGGIAIAGGSDDGDRPATGPGADQARATALALYPGSRANAVERDSEDGATWEVEITKPDGTTVDVRLDAWYHLVVAESDSEDPEE